jgi:hypothetical protein
VSKGVIILSLLSKWQTGEQQNKEDYSVEIPTRCSFVIEFIIPKFSKGSTCFERYIAHHQEL